MSKLNINLGAERALLATLAARPNEIFDVDTTLIRDTDFASAITQTIYIALRDLAHEQTANNNQPIDAILLEEKVASTFPNVYEAQKSDFSKAIGAIKSTPPATDIREYLRIVVSNSVKRRLYERMDTIKKRTDKLTTPTEIIELVENDIYGFTNELLQGEDLDNLATGYDDYLRRLAEEVKANKDGRAQVGLSTGLPSWDKAIGGGLRRGTINTIAARAGYGKSLMAGNIALHLIGQDIPVLYLDTELDRTLQMNRLSAIKAGVSIRRIEEGRIFSSEEDRNKVLLAKDFIASKQLDYVSIKGWSPSEQTSVIRRWIAKRVGRKEDGQFRHGVIILDYFKFMQDKDKGNNKEWEALGYTMTLLHDLMSQYGQSMVMFAQQNRSGLDREDEGTVSGSDRIIWLCDNFSVLYKVPIATPAEAEEVADEDDMLPNMGIKVSKCRHGRGTPPRRYIGIYADKEDPRVVEEEVCGRLVDRGMQVETNV